MAKVCLPTKGTGRYGQNLGPSSTDGIGYIKYVGVSQTDDASFPEQIIPLIDSGKIFCSVQSSMSDKRVIEEYDSKQLMQVIREATAESTHELAIQRKKEAVAVRLAKVQEQFGDFDFDDTSTKDSNSLGPILD